MNHVLQGDCLELMKDIPDKSIDLVLTSPSYNMNLRIRNGKHCSRQIVKELTTKYVSFADNLPMNEYFEFNKKVINECLRVSNLVFYNIQILTGNKSAIYKLMGEFNENIKEIIVWDKVKAEPAIGESVLNSRFELILVLSSKEDAISRKFKSSNFKRGTLQNLFQIKKGARIAKNHKAVFPRELAEKIIENFTQRGEIVLDPLAGTGTTGVACQNLNRNFILIEKEQEYIDIIKQRLTK